MKKIRILLFLLIPVIFSGCALFKAPRIATDSENAINLNVADGKTTREQVENIYKRGIPVGEKNNNIQFYYYDNDYATPLGTYITHTKLILLYKNDRVFKHHLIRYNNEINTDFVLNSTKEKFDTEIRDGITTLKEIQSKYGAPSRMGYETKDNHLFYMYRSDSLNRHSLIIAGIDPRLFSKLKSSLLTITFSDQGVVESHVFGSTENYIFSSHSK